MRIRTGMLGALYGIGIVPEFIVDDAIPTPSRHRPPYAAGWRQIAKKSRYMPHQGANECARRRRQMGQSE